MKRYLALILALLILSLAFGKDWNQYYFRFQLKDKSRLSELSSIISIDNIQGSWVYAYANDAEYEAFTKLGFKSYILPAPSSLIEPRMSHSVQDTRLWDSYPSYNSYINTMHAFASEHPQLCQIVDAGQTSQNRKILFAKLSNEVSQTVAKPRIMLSSTIHGDETTGFILMLRLIDTLLQAYGNNPRITNLLDNLEIWISPNTNPDGTYYTGNSSVAGARRYNANGYDLNRNFPDPNGNQYINQPLQMETVHMMNLMTEQHFALAANFHGGAEVVNYPWDYSRILHPDDGWYQSISHLYANSVQANGPAGYFTSVSADGVVRGSDWYVITGGKQDWANYGAHSREVTIEVSNIKMPPASTLPNYWSYNYEAILSFMEQALYGIHGCVKDSDGSPLQATIMIQAHDNASSQVFSDAQTGCFYRYLNPGSYNLSISCAGYPDKLIENVVVNANVKTPLNVVMGEAEHYQTICLNSGWNLISFNVILDDDDIISVFGDNLLQIKDSSLSFSPLVSSHLNTLSSLDSGKGYWVQVQSDQSLSIQGSLLDLDLFCQELKPGWNLVPYLPEEALPVSLAFSSIISQLLTVRSIDASWQAGGGELQLLEPGKAYLVQVSEACVLRYWGRSILKAVSF